MSGRPVEMVRFGESEEEFGDVKLGAGVGAHACRGDGHVKAVVVQTFGGPESLTHQAVDPPEAGPGQVLVELAVAGVNFLDVYQRTGATPLAPPFRAGVEGVGHIVALGPGVSGLEIGQRVGWLSGGQGSFSAVTAVDAARAIPVSDGVADETAAAALMQGITAHYLTTDTYQVRPGDTVLVHAAAGGVGLMLVQMAKMFGARVIGTTSTAEKAEHARSFGADHVVGYDKALETVRSTTPEGAAVVYDGVGATTFDDSLASLRPRGVLVVYGASSGPPPPLNIARLNTGGSLYVTRPTVVNYTATTEELRRRAADVFQWIAEGRLQTHIGGRFPIDRAQDAFTALESRDSVGKLLLLH